MPALFDQISASTLPAFSRGVVSRTLFTATALLRILRSQKSIFRPWQGGQFYFVSFENQAIPAAFYSPGVDVFSLDEIQTFDGQVFSPRTVAAPVVINLAITDLYNIGPSKFVDVLKERYGNASNSVDSQVAAALYVHGQANSSTVASNRVKAMNGLAEAINDGLTPAWTGDVFNLYGNQTRNSANNGTTLNSIPFWGGNSDGSAAAINLQILNFLYGTCKQGKGEGKLIGGLPDLIFLSDYLYSRVRGLLFPMQRTSNEVKEPRIGFSGFSFNTATILADSYSPGTQNARYIQDANVLPTITTGTYALSGTRLTGARTNGAFNGFGTAASPIVPDNTTITVGETVWMWRTDTWRFSYPKTGAYAFKNRGLMQSIDGDMQADIIRGAMVLHTYVPSSNNASYGFI